MDPRYPEGGHITRPKTAQLGWGLRACHSVSLLAGNAGPFQVQEIPKGVDITKGIRDMTGQAGPTLRAN